MRALLALFLFTAPLFAQPRAVEVFGQLGRSRLGGDEGSPGSTTTYGGGVVVPLVARWAIDMDVQTGRLSSEVSPPDRFTNRQTLLSPAVVRRWGTSRLYGLAGGGLGLAVDQSRSQYRTYGGSPPVQTGFVDASATDLGLTILGKLGLVVAPAGPLLIRSDLILSFRYVLPTVGARIGVGYRF